MTVRLEQGLYGCVSSEGYRQIGRNGAARIPTLKGRPKYRYKDAFARYVVSVMIEADQGQFTYWQGFWKTIRNGVDPFLMAIMMDSVTIYNGTNEEYLVHALAGWSATQSVDARWQIRLELEVS